MIFARSMNTVRIVIPAKAGRPRLDLLAELRRGWPGQRRSEATPSFGRLCPAMTLGASCPAQSKAASIRTGRIRNLARIGIGNVTRLTLLRFLRRQRPRLRARADRAGGHGRLQCSLHCGDLLPQFLLLGPQRVDCRGNLLVCRILGADSSPQGVHLARRADGRLARYFNGGRIRRRHSCRGRRLGQRVRQNQNRADACNACPNPSRILLQDAHRALLLVKEVFLPGHEILGQFRQRWFFHVRSPVAERPEHAKGEQLCYGSRRRGISRKSCILAKCFLNCRRSPAAADVVDGGEDALGRGG